MGTGIGYSGRSGGVQLELQGFRCPENTKRGPVAVAQRLAQLPTRLPSLPEKAGLAAGSSGTTAVQCSLALQKCSTGRGINARESTTWAVLLVGMLHAACHASK